MNEDFYRELGVSRGADQAEIKKAYRKLARKLHPDKNKGDKASEERFKRVSAAYAVLGDKDKRKLYDEFGIDGLRDGFDPDQWRRYGGGGKPGGGFSGEPFQGGMDFGGFSGFGGMEDIFETLFGQQRGGRGGPGRARMAHRKGPQLKSELRIELMDAVLGRELSIVIPVDGERRKLNVTIPRGIESGMKIRLKGQGGVSPNGGESGDLILEVQVADDAVYSRHGNDLEKAESITVGQAYFGDSIGVETPWGNGKLKVPAKSQGGRKLRIKGQGVRTSKGVGDLYVVLNIKIPEADGNAAENTVAGFEKLYE